ncbi:circadian clock KaiB family protein [Arenibacter certesii]|uniref:Circadian clock protein KaiB n=1 Tax=Arenibacter certesii TaxID=228955 RepID=A0A918IMT7_9FLAO|nr:circadian clock KaiB family protein [Arenibacter certesii]GGW23018.1 circadian clock protein KaiB [Arenibacter certesii]
MNKDENIKMVAEGKLVLQLYVSGMSANSMVAIENIKHLCDEHLEGAFQLEIIDIYKNPDLAAEEHIVFSPSLIKHFPLPRKTLIGNLSDTDKVVKALGLKIKGAS